MWVPSPCGSVDTSRGGRQPPEAAAAATGAIWIGLASTLHWPMAAAARSAASLGVGNWLPATGTGNRNVALKPNRSAIAFKAFLGRVLAIWMNAVLQLWAKAWGKVS